MKLSSGKLILMAVFAVPLGLLLADEYPALRFSGDGNFSGGPIFGYNIKMRSIPFYQPGEYVFHFHGMPKEEMTLFYYVEGKQYTDQRELTHLQTTLEAKLLDHNGRMVYQASGLPLNDDHGPCDPCETPQNDANQPKRPLPHGWVLTTGEFGNGGFDEAAFYHTDWGGAPLKRSESYTLTLRIRDVDPKTPKINLLPVLVGGQLDLP